MKTAFLLSKQNIPLAVKEVIALTDAKEYEIVDNLLILNSGFNDYERLAYTKRVYQLLFITFKKTLKKDFERFNWQSIYNKNFCIRVINSKESEKELAGYVWNSLKNPKVNLENPETEIHLIKKKSKFFCCKLIKEIKGGEFEERMPHKRPAMHPSSLHPRLARAVINLTGIKRGAVLDPFCGTGGILIEAGLIGLKPIGYDIDKAMIKRAEANLKHYKLKNYLLELRDSTLLNKKVDYIVTDLPYGRNTSPKNLLRTYEDFLKALDNILVKKAVVIFPDFINYKRIIGKTNLKIENEFTYYIHKSLSKKIVLIKK